MKFKIDENLPVEFVNVLESTGYKAMTALEQGLEGKADSEVINKCLEEKVVEEVIAWMQEENKEIPEPFGLKKYKGNLTLRVPAEVHRKLSIKSAEEGVSVNQYILSKIS